MTLKKTKKSGAFVVFFASLLWATDNPLRKPLLTGGLSVSFVSFLEHLINSIASLPSLWRGRSQFKLLSRRNLAGLIYIGAGSSALGGVLFVQAAVLMNYNFTVAALLQKLQPLFAIVLAVIFLKEKLNKKFWLFAAPALFGAYLVTFGAAGPGEILRGWTYGFWGPVLAVVTALLWAGGTVVGRSLVKDLDYKFVNSLRFIFGFLFLAAYLPFAGGAQFHLMTPFFWRNTIIIALVTGFFSLLFYYSGLRRTPASIATLMELGYPVALAAVNWKFLGIALSAWQILGALILLVSVTLLALLNGSVETSPP